MTEATDKCDECGEDKPDTKERLNPFLDEIHNEKVMQKLCDDCFQMWCDEI